jgi:IclR family pca regulon transcriptional regulator
MGRPTNCLIFDAEGQHRLSIPEVAEAAGLTLATPGRCLLTLHEAGNADGDGKCYTPTPRVLRLGKRTVAAPPGPVASIA